MAYHVWGDKWPHWDDLNDAVDYIGRYCWALGRIHGYSKEKYGTVRFDVFFSSNWLLRKWQQLVYVAVHLRALKKWPHLREEILSEAEYKELFPLSICREANKNWYRSATPGDLIYIPPSYRIMIAVVNERDAKTLWLQASDGSPYWSYKELYRHWDGCRIG